MVNELRQILPSQVNMTRNRYERRSMKLTNATKGIQVAGQIFSNVHHPSINGRKLGLVSGCLQQYLSLDCQHVKTKVAFYKYQKGRWFYFLKMKIYLCNFLPHWGLPTDTVRPYILMSLTGWVNRETKEAMFVVHEQKRHYPIMIGYQKTVAISVCMGSSTAHPGKKIMYHELPNRRGLRRLPSSKIHAKVSHSTILQ